MPGSTLHAAMRTTLECLALASRTEMKSDASRQFAHPHSAVEWGTVHS